MCYSPKRRHLYQKTKVANISQIVTIDKERFEKKVSKLKPKNLIKIEDGIKLVLSIG